MITEFAAAGLITYTYNYFTNEKMIVKRTIRNIFKVNNLDYKIIKFQETKYGYKLIISLYGVGYEGLEKSKGLIESSTGYMTTTQQNDNLKTATISLIKEKLSETTPFFPIPQESPYLIYSGLSYEYDELIVDMNKFPHILVSGQTGSGKTEIIRLILTNLIYSFPDRDINIYFSDLSDTCDFDIFRYCQQVKGYARTIQESEKLFNYLLHTYTKRLEIFSSNYSKNIKEYNEKNPEKRMTYNYLVLDEFADYFPSNKYETDYEKKEVCYNLLRHMVRKFRKAGIFLIIGIQRPDTTVLDPSLRSGLCTKIGFSQNTDSSSLVVCDNTDLTNVENRKGLFMYGNQRIWFKSLFINDKVIKNYIKSSISLNKPDFNKFLTKDKAIIEKPIEKAVSKVKKVKK